MGTRRRAESADVAIGLPMASVRNESRGIERRKRKRKGEGGGGGGRDEGQRQKRGGEGGRRSRRWQCVYAQNLISSSSVRPPLAFPSPPAPPRPSTLRPISSSFTVAKKTRTFRGGILGTDIELSVGGCLVFSSPSRPPPAASAPPLLPHDANTQLY